MITKEAKMARTGFAIGGQIPRTDVIELVQTAERRGFETFWFTEGSGKDALTQIAGVGPLTTKIKLGTGIVIHYTRTPSLLTMTLITLDEITNNRVILGLGTGSPKVKDNHGVPFEKPLGVMRDYVTIIKSALKGGPVSHNGKSYSINGFQLGFPAPRPNAPIYVAALNPSITQLAGEVADGVIFYVMTPDAVKEVLPYLKLGAEKAGRKVSDIAVTCFILANPDDSQEGIHSLKLQLSGFAASPPYKRRLSESGFSKEMEGAAKALANGDLNGAANAISDRMAESIAFIGDPSKWNDLINKYRAAGVDEPIIFPTGTSQQSMQLMRKALSIDLE